MANLQRECILSASGPFFHFIRHGTPNNFLSGANANYSVIPIKGRLDAKTAIFSAVSEALSFPDYFGENWDAFDECLNDLSWLPAKGYILNLEHADDLLVLPKDDLKIFFAVLSKAIHNWQEEKKPLHVVFIGSDALFQKLKELIDKEICFH